MQPPPLNSPDNTYRHYKGGLYQLLHTAIHTETEEKLVIYRSIEQPHKVWARPYDMFFATVVIEDKEIPRFEKVTP